MSLLTPEYDFAFTDTLALGTTTAYISVLQAFVIIIIII